MYIKSRFPTGNRPASELSDLFSEKQEIVPLDTNSFCLLHQEFKDFLLKLRPNWGSSFYFDELIGKVSVGVVDRKSSEEALLFALNYRSPRNHLTLLEALDSTGNFEDAKKCEAILYKLPTEKPERYSMGRSLREIVGCFAGAKNYDG